MLVSSTVTLRLKLPNPRLQYFLHSSISMLSSQGIYGRLTKINCNYDVFTAPIFSVPPYFVKFNIRVPVLDCLTQKINSLQASLSKNTVTNVGTPAYSYLPLLQEREFEPLMEIRCVRPLPIIVTCET
jgi:hypothetical protein